LRRVISSREITPSARSTMGRASEIPAGCSSLR
jgi:hypothetical protein